MSEPKILGVVGAIEQRKRFTWHPTQGPSTIRTWIGPAASIVPLLNQLQALGYSYEFGPSGGQNYQVEASIGFGINGSSPNDPENVINLWEMIPNAVEKDLLRADIAAINAISAQQKANLQTSINNNDPLVTTPTGSAAITDSTAIALWPYMKRGESSVKVFAPVIRHTQTVSNAYSIPASITNVTRIISTASMTTLEGIPSAILFTVPNNTDPSDTNLKYGWFKNYPSVTYAAFQKAQIVQEWEYGLWNTIVYGSRL